MAEVKTYDYRSVIEMLDFVKDEILVLNSQRLFNDLVIYTDKKGSITYSREINITEEEQVLSQILNDAKVEGKESKLVNI